MPRPGLKCPSAGIEVCADLNLACFLVKRTVSLSLLGSANKQHPIKMPGSLQRGPMHGFKQEISCKTRAHGLNKVWETKP